LIEGHFLVKKDSSKTPRLKPRKALAPKGSTGEPRAPSLAELAYTEIRNQILSGELPFGVAIARRKLAESLGISVPPITEALQRLERDGLVESKPRVGTRVRVPTREDIEDRSFLREALETQAARLFAERASPEEKEELRKMGRRVDQLYAASEESSGDREFLFSVNSYHMKLHLYIAECARCPSLRDAIEREQVLIFNWLHDTVVERRELGSDFHTRLADALTSGTPAEAGEAMRAHIRHGLNEVLSGLDRIDEAQRWRHKRA
jgi:GntR family transcriptional regulator, rspAB operon transcriptional repressor